MHQATKYRIKQKFSHHDLQKETINKKSLTAHVCTLQLLRLNLNTDWKLYEYSPGNIIPEFSEISTIRNKLILALIKANNNG